MATEKLPAANDDAVVNPTSAAFGKVDRDHAGDDIIGFAKSASDKERRMTLMQGVRLYPKAIAWSVLISTCIAMEGYDICLVNNFCKSQAAAAMVSMSDLTW